MTWLVVDAMNVIGARPDGWWRDRPAAVDQLVEAVRSHASTLADRVTVVVDGRGDDVVLDDGRVEVLYAPGGPDAADDRIVALLDGADATATVVTADRGLRARLPEGVEVEGPRTLRRRLDH